ncbi:MAG: retroviral-like aspartic protease family protein [Blastocatellia bacterium]|nr:retroviral-like aspartic protease family protein [Blastocatellia bacterium]
MSLSFDPKKGLIVVPTRLFGPNGDVLLRLALDTGATASMVNWDVVVLVGYDPAIVPGRIPVTTGSSIEFVPRIIVEKIEALEQERLDFPVLCHTLPPSATVDGVLGLDYLRGQRLIVDFRAGLVTLE